MVKGSMFSKRSDTKTKKSSKSASGKRSHAHAKSSAKRKTRTAGRVAKAARPARAQKAMRPETKKVSAAGKTATAEVSRLLRETKATTAALGLLARGIKLIYQKEFRKARVELKSLIESYPAEPEILARARTYLRICDREEAAHKKPVIANDQLYTLGVMEHNRGDYEKAVTYFRQSLEKSPNSDHIYYSLAASFAVKGEIAEALRNLQKAVELNEENRVFAKNDSDFAPLHGEKEFSDLVGWSQPAAGG
jgi:tetratricopeptide (TPR) repeat protein